MKKRLMSVFTIQLQRGGFLQCLFSQPDRVKHRLNICRRRLLARRADRRSSYSGSTRVYKCLNQSDVVLKHPLRLPERARSPRQPSRPHCIACRGSTRPGFPASMQAWQSQSNMYRSLSSLDRSRRGSETSTYEVRIYAASIRFITPPVLTSGARAYLLAWFQSSDCDHFEGI